MRLPREKNTGLVIIPLFRIRIIFETGLAGIDVVTIQTFFPQLYRPN